MPVFQTFTDFRNRYLNRYVKLRTEDGTERVSAGKYWLAHPGRNTFDGVAFEPGEPQFLWGNRLNLWRDFAVKPKKGSWRLLRRHIYLVLGCGDWKAGRYIYRWLAWTAQNPSLPAEAVLVFQGDEGAGKGTLARAMIKIFGPYGLPVSEGKQLTGSFSGHLHHCVFLFVDEAFWAGNVAIEGRLKSLITEETITIEPKYFTTFTVRNMLHIMMCSNNDWVVPAGKDARRYVVFGVGREKIGDFGYFNRLNAEIDDGGVEAMLYDLLRLDLRGWHPKQIYKTEALTEQKLHSLKGLDAWIEDMLQAGKLPVPLSEKYPNRCLSDNLENDAKRFDKYTNSTRIADKLHKVFGGRVEPFNIQSQRGWIFPPLAECRQTWARRYGGSWPWHHAIEEWQPLIPFVDRTF